MTPFIVVVAGGTASGKSTIVLELCRVTGALHLMHDRYYKDVYQPRGHNYDEPDALDTERLVADLSLLRAGQPADLPVYDFRTHRRQAQVDPTEPRPLIVVEGILTLCDSRVRELAHLKVYVDCPDDLRLARRIRRDLKSRARDLDEVLDQYLETVRPMHQVHVAPSRTWADLVVSGESPVMSSVAAIRSEIQARGGPGASEPLSAR